MQTHKHTTPQHHIRTTHNNSYFCSLSPFLLSLKFSSSCGQRPQVQPLIVSIIVKKVLKKNSENNEVRREDFEPLDDGHIVENIAINH